MRRLDALHIAALLLVCAGAYWLGLGAPSFQETEGHRVAPAWRMLAGGDPLVPELFGQPYLRKPPGVPWAIALSCAVFGHNEWAARAPSALAATLAVLVAWAFATRWFGRPWGFAGGLAQALTPLFIESARRAEIEAIHNLAIQLAGLAIVDRLAFTARRGGAITALGALGIVLAGLAKGPAGAPILVGVVAGACVARRGLAPLQTRALWAMLVAAGVPLAFVSWRIALAVARLESPGVAQNPADFLWDLRRLGGVAGLAPITFVAALPLTLALAFPWGARARSESTRDAGVDPGLLAARAISAGWFVSIAACLAVGISNPRYAMPAAMLLAPLSAYLVRGAMLGWLTHWPSLGRFAGSRRRAARILMLGSPMALGGVMLVVSGVWAGIVTLRDQGSTARDAGRTIAAVLGSLPGTDAHEVWADNLVEASPQVLLYASRACADLGVHARFRWVIPVNPKKPAIPLDGPLLLIRDDPKSLEHMAYYDAAASAGVELRELARIHVADYTAILVRPARILTP